MMMLTVRLLRPGFGREGKVSEREGMVHVLNMLRGARMRNSCCGVRGKARSRTLTVEFGRRVQRVGGEGAAGGGGAYDDEVGVVGRCVGEKGDR